MFHLINEFSCLACLVTCTCPLQVVDFCVLYRVQYLYLNPRMSKSRASLVMLLVKNQPASARDMGDLGSIPGSGRCPGGGHGNPLQYSCLENPMDRGILQAVAHGVAQSLT